MFKNYRYNEKSEDVLDSCKENIDIILEENIKILEQLVNCPVTIFYNDKQYGNLRPTRAVFAAECVGILEEFKWHGCVAYRVTNGVILFWGQYNKLRKMRNLLYSVARQIDLVIQNHILTNKLRELSITDELTGLHNRRYFMEELTKLLEYSKRENKIMALCVIDIDKFKSYNDSFGHPEGDKLLIELSKVLKDSIRAVDTSGRLGGEEFGVILNSVDNLEGAREVAERIRVYIENNLNTNTGRAKRQVTVSIGVAITSELDTISVDEMYKLADSRLYIAKDRGRNMVVIG